MAITQVQPTPNDVLQAQRYLGLVVSDRESERVQQEIEQRAHARQAAKAEKTRQDSKAFYVKTAPKPTITDTRKQSIKQQVLNLIKRSGDRGIIAEDACRELVGTRYSSVTSRFSELERTGLIVASGERATVYSGNNAVVWKLKKVM